MKKHIVIILFTLLSTACSSPRHHDGMKMQLDAIRVMIKQSALMAVQAACVSGGEKSMLIHAAAVQDRRAMGGPEMAKIHKMMNMKPDASGGMAMNMGKDDKMSAEMKMHVSLHDAGEDVFDLLDGIGETPGISCRQIAPAALAASAAMLRESTAGEATGSEATSSAKKLDLSATAMLNQQHGESIAPQVRALTLALQRI